MKHSHFTLIEMIIVLLIVSLLVALAIPYYSNTADKTKIIKIQSDLEGLNLIIGQYLITHMKYPVSINQLVTDGLIETVPLDPYGRGYHLRTRTTSQGEEYYLESEAMYAGSKMMFGTIEVICGVDPGDEY